MQQFLKEQLLDQTLKFTSWKCLTILDLKSQFRLQRNQDGHPMFWFPKDRVDSWTNCISRKSDMMSPVRSEHANAKESEPSLATIDRRILLRRLLQVVRAPGNWMRTLSAFLPAQCACSQKEPFLRRKGSGKILLPINSSYGGSLPTAISKMVTRLVRHYDQEERQSDGAVHGGTIGPKLVKVFAKQGARDFSEEALASTHPWRKQQDTVRILRGFQKLFGLLSSNSRTLWWNNNCSWIDGAQLNSLRLETNCVSQGLFFQNQSILEKGLIAGRNSKQARTTDHLLHTSQPIRWKSRWTSTQWWHHNSQESALS